MELLCIYWPLILVVYFAIKLKICPGILIVKLIKQVDFVRPSFEPCILSFKSIGETNFELLRFVKCLRVMILARVVEFYLVKAQILSSGLSLTLFEGENKCPC